MWLWLKLLDLLWQPPFLFRYETGGSESTARPRLGSHRGSRRMLHPLWWWKNSDLPGLLRSHAPGVENRTFPKVKKWLKHCWMLGIKIQNMNHNSLLSTWIHQYFSRRSSNSSMSKVCGKLLAPGSNATVFSAAATCGERLAVGIVVAAHDPTKICHYG